MEMLITHQMRMVTPFSSHKSGLAGGGAAAVWLSGAPHLCSRDTYHEICTSSNEDDETSEIGTSSSLSET